MKTSEKLLEEMFREYEQRIGRLRELEAELNMLDTVGYEEATEKLRRKLKKPVLLEEIERDFKSLKVALSEVKVLFDNACAHQEKGKQFFAVAKYQTALEEFGASAASFGKVASDTENLGRHSLLEPLVLRQKGVEVSLIQTRCAMICEKSQEAEAHFQKGKIDIALKLYEEVIEQFRQESHKAEQIGDQDMIAQLADWIKTTEVSLENCRISLDKTNVEEMYSRARLLSEDVVAKSVEGKFYEASRPLDQIEVLIRDALVVAAERDFKEARSNLHKLLTEVTEKKKSIYNAISTGATSVRFGGKVKEICKGEEPEIGSSIFSRLFSEDEKRGEGNGRSTEFIDFFRQLTLIGEGGMGAVYLFVNPRLKRKEAIKIMREDLQTDKRAVKSFLAEARIAGNLNHENIIKIHDVIENPWLAIRMEFVDGKDLHTLIDEEHMLSWQRAARIAFHACNALCYAHENSIAHRDVKPKNILVRNDGLVKVVDFGISIAVASTTGSGPGRQTLGGYSPLYSSPEQRSGCLKDPKSSLWFKSDMYAFGATCYEMVTGSPPFPPGSDLTYNHQHLRPESPASHANELPEPFEKLIMACLEKDPDARLGAREVLKILSGLFRSRPFWSERTVEAEEDKDWMVTR